MTPRKTEPALRLDSWSEEEERVLREGLAEGLSAAMISRALKGRRSRNAVIGRASRLKLAMGNTKADGLKFRQDVPPPQTRARPRSATPMPPGAAIPLPRSGGCKWPFGDPGEPGFRFCDDASIPGKVYCKAHHAVAYRPPPREDNPRRRQDVRRVFG